MRITRESLLKTTRTIVAQRTYVNRRLVCIYLTGSLRFEEPLLGGATDIDLFFIHDSEPPAAREIERITDDVHLDITHLSQSVFSQPRNLRCDPWLGTFLCQDPLVLHDVQHWFEFTQAAVCAQFHQPENVLKRARPRLEEARRLWFEAQDAVGLQRLNLYLNALDEAGQVLGNLHGTPLTERRFFVQLAESARALGKPGLAGGLADLIMSEEAHSDNWQRWLPVWSHALQLASAQPGHDICVHPARVGYYTRGAAALFDDLPAAGLWVLLRTWSRAVACLPENETEAIDSFTRVLTALELDDERFSNRLDGLDSYLDSLEETLEVWEKNNGL